MTIQDIFTEIEKEMPRSLALHPQAEWDELSFTRIIRAADKELKEAQDAYVVKDFDGEHGVQAELTHAIIVLIRAKMEMYRRHGENK